MQNKIKKILTASIKYIVDSEKLIAFFSSSENCFDNFVSIFYFLTWQLFAMFSGNT